jgi:hypothetical protein
MSRAIARERESEQASERNREAESEREPATVLAGTPSKEDRDEWNPEFWKSFVQDDGPRR